MTLPENSIKLDQSDPVPLDPIILRARDELLEKYSDKINFIHFDMDIYEPTKIALSLMKNRIKKG